VFDRTRVSLFGKETLMPALAASFIQDLTSSPISRAVKVSSTYRSSAS